MSDWRQDVQEERPHFAPSTLEDGDEMTVEFQNDGVETKTRKGDAVTFQVIIRDAPNDATDMNDEELVIGDEYTLMTSSSRLLFELSEYAETLEGEEVTISAEGAQKSFDRDYFVSPA